MSARRTLRLPVRSGGLVIAIAAATVAFALWWQVPVRTGPGVPESFLVVVPSTASGPSSLAVDAAEVRDTSAYYLPTRWSYGGGIADERDGRGMRPVFPLRPPEPALGAAALDAAAAVQSKRVDPVFLAAGRLEPSIALGRRDPEISDEGSAGLLVVLRLEAGSEVVRWGRVPALETAMEGTEGERPLELAFLVVETGVVGPPFVLSGSGDAAADWAVARRVEAWVRSAPPDRPGYYRATAGR